jgi:hypothetical protein
MLYPCRLHRSLLGLQGYCSSKFLRYLCLQRFHSVAPSSQQKVRRKLLLLLHVTWHVVETIEGLKTTRPKRPFKHIDFISASSCLSGHYFKQIFEPTGKNSRLDKQAFSAKAQSFCLAPLKWSSYSSTFVKQNTDLCSYLPRQTYVGKTWALQVIFGFKQIWIACSVTEWFCRKNRKKCRPIHFFDTLFPWNNFFRGISSQKFGMLLHFSK